ncbi:SDR family oxidoreductase [Streptomyces sp. NPDC059752]|uniref:SDR family oxidoreductase n=1 Tax=unclassified Streptomyces TaxID=2593676 RepID=UPI003662B507
MPEPLIVITGASSGIGAATARLLSSQGHPLLLLARRLEQLEALGLPDALCRKVDVTDREAVKAAVREAEERYGPVDLLVNNAGAVLPGRIADQPVDEWEQMLDVNVKGLLYATRAVLPGMVGRGAGTIVNISSVAGRKTFPNHVAYAGTKFAVHAMSENLREEVAATGRRPVHGHHLGSLGRPVTLLRKAGHTARQHPLRDPVYGSTSVIRDARPATPSSVRPRSR